MPPQEPIDVGFLIGNGSSRRGFDLNRLTGHGVTVGCNLVFRDYSPHYIVAIDERIVDEALAALAAGATWRFIARTYLDGRQWWLCADNEKVSPFSAINYRMNQDTGILGAYFLASTLKARKLYMLGIDFFRPTAGEINSLYEDASLPEKVKIEVAWNALARDNPETQFIRVGPIRDADREYFETKVDGITFLESFEDMPI